MPVKVRPVMRGPGSPLSNRLNSVTTWLGSGQYTSELRYRIMSTVKTFGGLLSDLQL